MYAIVVAVLGGLAFAGPILDQRPKDMREAVYKDLSKKLATAKAPIKAAQVELDYWHHSAAIFETKQLDLKNGKTAELYLLTSPATTMPGEDFSMAFLLIDAEIVDWTSCWTSNRLVSQKTLLEDVDGDGQPDLAFRVRDVWARASDKRNHSLAGDDRRWLYAYQISERGFKSLFQETDRELPIKIEYDVGDHPVTMRVEGLPPKLRENRLVRIRITVRNDSKQDIAIKPNGWFELKAENAGYSMRYSTSSKPKELRPGEMRSETVDFRIEGYGDEVTLRCKLVP